jgi:hypothetical protein
MGPVRRFNGAVNLVNGRLAATSEQWGCALLPDGDSRARAT